jgi:hypothetical protein
MKYDPRIFVLVVLCSFLFAHPVVAYLGNGKFFSPLDGVRRADRGTFADEMN